MATRQIQQIDEIDQLIESWPGSAIRPVQTTAGRLDLRMDGVVDEVLSVFHLSLAPRLIDHVQTGETRTGFVLVERPMVSMGVEITPPALLISHPGKEYRSVLQPGFRSVEFILCNRSIENLRLSSLLADARTVQDQTVVPLNDLLRVELKAVARAYICACETGESCLIEATRDRVIDRLTRMLEQHRDLTFSEAPAPARGSIAVAALREIERTGVHHVKLKDVCGSLGVSRRAVEKSFSNVFGISPAQYLLACRLNRFRLSLLGPAKRVSDGLADAGLSDASRAARQYRRLFGELPSATLSRARARL